LIISISISSVFHPWPSLSWDYSSSFKAAFHGQNSQSGTAGVAKIKSLNRKRRDAVNRAAQRTPREPLGPFVINAEKTLQIFT